MKADTIKLIFSYTIALGILVGSYYALILSPYVVPDDVKLWLTSAAGGAIAFVFGDQVASRTRVEQQSAFTKGLDATPNGHPVDPIP